MTVTDLGLTPTQTAELDQYDPDHINAWLQATLEAGNAIKSPAGWFLAGLRSGRPPEEARDTAKAKAEALAVKYIQQAGLLLPTEAELLDDLFGPHGRLKHWADDQRMRDRMLDHWRDQQDRVDTAEQAAQERAHKIRDQRGLPGLIARAERYALKTAWMEDEPAVPLFSEFPELPAAELERIAKLAQQKAKDEMSA